MYFKGAELIRRIMSFARRPKVLRILCLLALLFSARPLAAESKVLNVPFEPQQESLWCWAACLQAVSRYYGVYATQAELVGKIRLGDWGGVTGREADFNKAGNMGRTLAAMGISYRLTPGPVSTSYVTDEMRRSQPLIIGVSRPRASVGHCLVIFGLSDEGRYWVWDPTDGSKRDLSRAGIEDRYDEWDATYATQRSRAQDGLSESHHRFQMQEWDKLRQRIDRLDRRIHSGSSFD